MPTTRTLLTPALLSFALVAAAADSPSAWKWTPEAVVDTAAVGGVTLSPDGAAIVFVKTRPRPEDAKPGPAYANLWRVAVSGGEPQRLSFADAEDQRPRFAPDGRLGFLSRRGDPARTRIWVLPAGQGEAQALGDDKTDVAAFEWSPDGRSIAYVAVDPKTPEQEKDEKAGRDWTLVDHDLRPRRLFVLDPASGEIEKLAALGELSAWDFAWAPDGSALVASVTDRNRTDDSYMKKRLLVLPRQGESRELVGIVGKLGPVAWSKDGSTIAWIGGTDASDPAAGSLFTIPAAGGKPRNLTGERAETCTDLAFRSDGRLAVVSVVGTRTTLTLVDPATGSRELVVPAGPRVFGAASGSASGDRYAFAASTSAHPPEVFSLALPAIAGGRKAQPPAPARLTSSNPQLEGLPRGAQETIRYRARDGLEIEAVLVRPPGFTEGRRHPLVLVVHGGPEGVFEDGWLNTYANPGHALAERGFFVLFPNYRGSVGRGVAFSKADHQDLGGKEFTDVLDGVDHLVAKGWVDAKRVGITGGSYGGYFTAIGVTRHSERFAAGVNLFGITNWESYMGTTDIPEENTLVHWALRCYERPEACRQGSPVAWVRSAKTPTLILQGAEDLRVPKPQSDELYAALVWRGVPVEYVVYPREGHGFRERAHRLDTLTRMLAWFDRYLAATGVGID